MPFHWATTFLLMHCMALIMGAAVCGEDDAAEWTNSRGMTFVTVPAGLFHMGSDTTERYALGPNDVRRPRRDEFPLHPVRLTRDYRIGRYEVTVAQFRQFADQTGYRTEAEIVGAFIFRNDAWVHDRSANWRSPGYEIDDQMPVSCVSWRDAMAFCEWLNDTDTVRPEGWRYRLPTEAEWEYAARGSDRRLFPWGNNWAAGSCTAAGYAVHPSPVGLHGPKGDSPFGASDMAGNVWEWVLDWHSREFYRTCEVENPVNLGRPTLHGMRGGGWPNAPLQCRSAYRAMHSPGALLSCVGFRVVLVQEKVGYAADAFFRRSSPSAAPHYVSSGSSGFGTLGVLLSLACFLLIQYRRKCSTPAKRYSPST